MFIVHSNNQFRLKDSYSILGTLIEHYMNSQTRKNSFVTVAGAVHAENGPPKKLFTKN